MIVCSATPGAGAQERVGRARDRPARGGHLRPGSRQQERDSRPRDEGRLSAGKRVDDRRCSRRHGGGSRPSGPISFRSIRVRKTRAGSGSSSEACDRFLAGRYGGDYESGLVTEFETYLPDKPPWHTGDDEPGERRCQPAGSEFYDSKSLDRASGAKNRRADTRRSPGRKQGTLAMADQHDIGLIGLAVMGQNLVLNMANHGFSVGVFNRTTSKVDEFRRRPGQGQIDRRISLARPTSSPACKYAAQDHDDGQGRAGGRRTDRRAAAAPEPRRHPDRRRQHATFPTRSAASQRPRPRDCSTSARAFRAAKRGRSKGRASCRAGPAPPGRTSNRSCRRSAPRSGRRTTFPCCEWIGEGGSGHYVKMVHNGIEYGDMQLICEAYFLLKHALGLTQRRAVRRLRRLEQAPSWKAT